jgi:phage baseplate assembly protein W
MPNGKSDFLGQAWAFPPRINKAGGIGLAKQENSIEEGILMVLQTARGERRMRPEFGSDLHEFVFAPNNVTTFGRVAQAVREALARWEPRIIVTEVEVKADPKERHKLLIDVSYQIKATNDRRNLVYPFYLILRET